jgi:peptide chain release factor subunit 1
MDRSVQALPLLLTDLGKRTPPPEGILSVYLDTTPERIAGEAYLLAFRDGCRALRGTTPEAQSRALEAAIEQAERYLTESSISGRPGLALFASGLDAYFYAAGLPAAPGDELAWDSMPELAPLYAILDDYQRCAVVLFDTEQARLFTIYLGEIEDRRVIRDFVPGAQSTGGWFALAQTRYARHREQFVRRHVDHTTAALMAMLRAHPFDRLFLAGPPEPVALLQQRLPRPLRNRLAGRLSLELIASDADVLRVALEAADAVERQASEAALQELLGGAGEGRASLGPAGTLDALAEGRVRQLFVSASFMRPGWFCARCKHLYLEGATCPLCGAAMEAVADLRERAMALARTQDADVSVLTGPASTLLMEVDGMSAWLRFS